ncbi:hypothetical protein A3710_24075 [Stutzerimonas frequens]|nr:hypothetical protein A3710_24075 [Stutzerimonas frequens]
MKCLIRNTTTMEQAGYCQRLSGTQLFRQTLNSFPDLGFDVQRCDHDPTSPDCNTYPLDVLEHLAEYP